MTPICQEPMNSDCPLRVNLKAVYIIRSVVIVHAFTSFIKI